MDPKERSVSCKVIATMIVGSQNEPHLAQVLESVYGSVDGAVVDYNGENEFNWQALTSSKLYKEGHLRIEKSKFENYAQARNNTLRMLDRDTSWFFRLDADEVHFPEDLQKITRQILPSLKDRVGILDAYWLCFFHSFKYVRHLERRHDLFVRFYPDMLWTRNIHEQLQGKRGIRVAAPYVFHHYADIKDPQEFLAKQRDYVLRTNVESTLKKIKIIDNIHDHFLEHKEKGDILRYVGDFPDLDLPWLENPPPYLMEMQKELDELFDTVPSAQRGGKRRILFRLLPLLLNLTNWPARKEAINLARNLKLRLP